MFDISWTSRLRLRVAGANGDAIVYVLDPSSGKLLKKGCKYLSNKFHNVK